MEDIRSYREKEENPPRRFDEDDRRAEWDAASKNEDELPFDIPRD